MVALTKHGRQQAMQLVGYQAITVYLLAVIAALIWGLPVASSVAAGGGVCLIANYVYAKLVFRRAGAQAAKKVLRAFYLGEVIKIVLTALLFGLIIFYTKIIMLALLLGYLLAQSVFWVALLF